MTSRYRLVFTIALTALLASACSDKDTTPPAPPIVDPIDSPTPDSVVHVSGTAEFGATVRVAGGVGAVETTADPYTAAWFADVELAAGDNTLSVTATDAAGNESAATEAAVTLIEPGNPASIVIEGPDTARAGESVTFTVTVLDDFGNVVPDAAYTLTTDAGAGSTTFTPPATIAFCEVGATVVTAQAGTDGPSASHTITIGDGRPAIVNLTLSDNAVVAGTTVTYTAEARDGCDNVTSDYIDVFTNAPGAAVAAGSITGLTRAGSWTVVAQVPGSNAVDSEPLLVDADASSTALVLQLGQSSAFVGVPLSYTVTAVDGYGNPVDQTTLAITTTDSSAVIDPATRTITFGTVGTPAHTVTATLFGATANQVSDSASVIVTNPDLAAPTVAIISPTAGTATAPGGVLSVTVRASDDQGLAQIFLQATGQADSFQQRLVPVNATTGLPELGPYDAVFAVDIPGGAIGTVTLVAQAVDNHGNITSSTAVTVTVDPALNIVVGAGLTVSTVSARGQIRSPRGLAVDAAGLIYITNNDDNFPLVVRADPAGPPLANQSVFVVPQFGRRGEDIVFYDSTAGTDFFFVSTSGANRIVRVEADGSPVETTWSANLGPTPRGLIVESQARIAAVYNDALVRRFNPTAAGPSVAASSSMDVTNSLGDAWGLELLSFGCPATQFPCPDGSCISNALVCNLVDNCPGTGTDETNCAAAASYRCNNLATVTPASLCDGNDDCGDNSDELFCSRYAATDNGAADEASSFYDNGNANTTAFDLMIGANLNNPRGIARSPSGAFVYVASRDGSAIFQIDGNAILDRNPCAGGCPVVATGFDEAWGLAFSGSALLITDHADDLVYRIQGLP